MDESDLPSSRRALLLIDFMNPLDFPGAQDLAGPALAAAREAAQLARAARRAAVPVIYTNDNFGAWKSDFSHLMRRVEARGGEARAMARVLRPQRGDLTVLKPMHSAFFGSPLDLLLTKIGARTLILTGLAADMCVQLTAGDALIRGYRTVVPCDCVASESEARKEAALNYMREILKCDTRPWRSSARLAS